MTKIDKAAEESLKERIAKGPPLPGPGSTYEQGFTAGVAWAVDECLKVVRAADTRADDDGGWLLYAARKIVMEVLEKEDS